MGKGRGRKDEGVPRLKLKDLRSAYERELIRAALSAASGNQRRAAAALGVLPTTLHEKMKRLGLLLPADDEIDPEGGTPGGETPPANGD